MIYLGVFATALATLILEVALTRLFSIAFWYHFAFLVISIALLGLGASGTFLTLFSSLLERPYRSLSNLSIIFSISIITIFIICRTVPFDPARIAWDSKQILYIFLYTFLLSIPFFFSGLTLSIAIAHSPLIVNKVYFSDLIGAGTGALATSLLFSFIEGSGVIIFASFMASLASLFFSMEEKTLQKRIFDVSIRAIWAIIIGFFLISKPQPFTSYLTLPISPYKDLKIALLYPDSKLLKTGWNAFSRVDIVDSPAVRYAPGLSLEYKKSLPPQLGITVDGSGLNAITEYKKEALGFISYLPSYLPYYIRLQTQDSRPHTNILIIEPGGGLPLLMALKGLETSAFSLQPSALNIDVVEKNPLIIHFVRDDFGQFSGDIYRDSRVKISIEEGRTFLKKSERYYDIIDLSKPGTASPTSTGLYGLVEDYTFTVDAFEEYIKGLKEKGLLSITRYLLPPPREEVRIISLVLDAFRRMGIDDPSDRIAAIRTWGTITILIKKTPFERDEIVRIKEFSKSRRFDIVYLKGLKPEEANIYNIFPEDLYFKTFGEILDPEKRAGLYRDYLFDLTPTTDDRPFFFHFFRIKKIIPTYQSMKDKWQPLIEGGYLVPVILIVSLALSFLLIILPLFWVNPVRKGGALDPALSNRQKFSIDSSPPQEVGLSNGVKKEKEAVAGGHGFEIILYFISIGLGFMLIEIAMIQKFILFLGKPIYSVSLVLFSILVATAMGSYFSTIGETMDLGNLKKRLKIAITFILIILILYYFLLDRILVSFLGSDFTVRCLIIFSILLPLGFFMGFFFPLGIRIADYHDRRLIPWAWASNGCASVVATSLSIMLAVTFGFSTVLLLAGGIYLLGYLSLFMKININP